MRNIALLFLFIASISTSNGQNKFFIGEKSYSSTEKFHLYSRKSWGRFGDEGHLLDVSVAKSGDSGMLTLTINGVEGARILGNILIDLDNHSVLSCIDKKLFTYDDNSATTVYFLTKSQISSMKSYDIKRIRFNIKCFKCGSRAVEQEYFATDQFPNFFLSENIKKTYSPNLINELFKN